jgi:chitinase
MDSGSYLAEVSVAVAYKQANGWSSGFNGDVTTTNQGTAAISGWTLEFDLDATITSVWNATIVSQSGSHYVIQPASWGATIAAGASFSFGLQATGPAGTSPRNKKFNGLAV